MKPFPIKNNLKEEVYVPCGKCPECLSRRASGWSFRLMQEERISSSSHFLTLTYDTQHVPITPAGFMNLDKRDVQLFMKKLRKVHSQKLKYYVVGEYGGKSNRPHYHMLLFNARVDLIQPAWDKGAIHYGDVSHASVGYTLKYMCKPPRIPMHRNDDRLREFSLMSKGLGLSYLSDNMIAWHWDDPQNRMYCNIDNGKKIAMPRYFKNKLYTDEERKEIGESTRSRMVTAQEHMLENYVGDYTRDYNEGIDAAYRKMYKQAAESRTKI